MNNNIKKFYLFIGTAGYENEKNSVSLYDILLQWCCLL